MTSELADHTLWREGPTWLSVDPVHSLIQPLDSVPELRVAACNLRIPVPPELTEGRYGCHHKTLKVTAWCLRYIHNLAASHNHQPKVIAPF